MKEKVTSLTYFDGILENAIELECVGRVGAGVGHERHVLKRRRTWSFEGFTGEGDPSLTVRLLDVLQLPSAKGCQHIRNKGHWSRHACTMNCRMKLANARRHALDRPDTACAVKTAQQSMAKTRQADAAAHRSLQVFFDTTRVCGAKDTRNCQRQLAAFMMQTSQREQRRCARRRAQPTREATCWHHERVGMSCRCVVAATHPEQQCRLELWRLGNLSLKTRSWQKLSRALRQT